MKIYVERPRFPVGVRVQVPVFSFDCKSKKTEKVHKYFYKDQGIWTVPMVPRYRNEIVRKRKLPFQVLVRMYFANLWATKKAEEPAPLSSLPWMWARSHFWSWIRPCWSPSPGTSRSGTPSPPTQNILIFTGDTRGHELYLSFEFSVWVWHLWNYHMITQVRVADPDLNSSPIGSGPFW